MILSSIPGRLRLEVPSLIKRPSLCKQLRDYLLTLEGVTQARVNCQTGRILLHFDTNKISEQQLSENLIKNMSVLGLIGATSAKAANTKRSQFKLNPTQAALLGMLGNTALNAFKSELMRVGFGAGVVQRVLLNMAFNTASQTISSLNPGRSTQ